MARQSRLPGGKEQKKAGEREHGSLLADTGKQSAPEDMKRAGTGRVGRGSLDHFTHHK